MSVTLSRSDCEAAVESFLESAEFTLVSYNIKPLSGRNTGFMGRHFKLTASIVFGKDHRDLHMFVKLPPANEKHREMVINGNFLSQEICFYNYFVPLFNECNPSGVKFPVPKCLFTRDTTGPEKIPDLDTTEREMILLEDVTFRGFNMIENISILDLPHCRVILKALARFHGASILLELSHMDQREEIFSRVKENMFVKQDGHLGYKWARSNAVTMATAVTKIWPERYREERENIASTLAQAWVNVFSYAVASDKYKNVLSHGDLWLSNILFAYEEGPAGEKVPVDALFVDLQCMRYAPPVLDIIHFLYVSTRRHFREQYLKELLEYYYSSLEELVSSNKLQKIFPFESLLESFEEYRDFGRLVSTSDISLIVGDYDPLLLSQNKEEEEMKLMDVFYGDVGDDIASYCEKSEAYKERVVESFQECLEALGLWRD